MPTTDYSILQLMQKKIPLIFSFNTAQSQRIAHPGLINCQIAVREEKKADGSIQKLLDIELHGHIEQICQRCLEPFMQDVALENTIECITHAKTYARMQAQMDDDTFDNIFVDKTTKLIPLVEDELILHLSIFPKHSICSVKTKINALPIIESDTEKQKPFAHLASLMAKNN